MIHIYMIHIYDTYIYMIYIYMIYIYICIIYIYIADMTSDLSPPPSARSCRVWRRPREVVVTRRAARVAARIADEPRTTRTTGVVGEDGWVLTTFQWDFLLGNVCKTIINHQYFDGLYHI